MNDKMIMEALESKGEPMKTSEIAIAIGVDKKEIDKTIKALIVAEKLYSPKRCFYDIKK